MSETRPLTLQDIFRAGLDDFLKAHRVPLAVHKAARAILHCRTAALGGHVKVCPAGHVEKVFYNSCGHRTCPKCAYLKIDQWLEKKRSMLLACDHVHLTFTLPSELYVVYRYNRRLLTDLFFRSAKEALFSLLADPKHLGAVPGLMLHLHTWNRALGFFPHLHGLATVGGLAADGTWKRPRRKHLLATDVLGAVFKRTFRDGFRRLLRLERIRLPPDLTPNDADWRLVLALSRKWVTFRKLYGHGEGVLTYLARYGRGGPLKERRLKAFDGERVTFVKSRPAEPYEEITLPTLEFIRQILSHVPPFNYRTVRCYGLYAPTAGDRRRVARAQLAGEVVVAHDELAEEIPGAWRRDGEPETCPVCDRELVKVAEIPRPRRRPRPKRPPPSPPVSLPGGIAA